MILEVGLREPLRRENLRQRKVPLISPRKGKSLTGLKPGIFAVSKRKPTFSERSAKRATIGIVPESQSFERS
jgi:hypothetical protein